MRRTLLPLLIGLCLSLLCIVPLSAQRRGHRPHPPRFRPMIRQQRFFRPVRPFRPQRAFRPARPRRSVVLVQPQRPLVLIQPRINLLQPVRPRPRRRQIQAPQDAYALSLLKRMLRPMVDYSGEQVTELVGQEIAPTRTLIKGDTKGRVRRDFLEPEEWRGDILLTGPGQYRFYHSRTNEMEFALWPVTENENDSRILQALSKRLLAVDYRGEETVAGRKAAIILLSGQPSSDAGRSQIKYWVDTETGIQLQNERTNPNGQVSRSYLTKITFGLTADVRPKDFEPDVLRSAKVLPVFPNPQFRDLQEAGNRLPFLPLQPATLPPGFQLNGVWVFGPPLPKNPRQASILLRYSNDLSSFTLYQHPVGAKAQPPKPNGRRRFQQNIQRWRVLNPQYGEIEVVYIGSLPPEQVQALYDSLH